jgi:hypothetical protein
MWIRTLTIAATIALVFAAGVQARPTAARDCGLTPRIEGVKYQVKVSRGSVSCATVKRVATTFLRSGTIKPPWTCFRNNNSSLGYAASCARGSKVLFRIIAPGH